MWKKKQFPIGFFLPHKSEKKNQNRHHVGIFLGKLFFLSEKKFPIGKCFPDTIGKTTK